MPIDWKEFKAEEGSPRELPLEFEGKGSVKGFHFRQLDFYPASEGSLGRYLYEVSSALGTIHYEIFERKINTKFNLVRYPNDESFGVWAKTCRKLDRAYAYLRDGLNAESVPQK